MENTNNDNDSSYHDDIYTYDSSDDDKLVIDENENYKDTSQMTNNDIPHPIYDIYDSDDDKLVIDKNETSQMTNYDTLHHRVIHDEKKSGEIVIIVGKENEEIEDKIVTGEADEDKIVTGEAAKEDEEAEKIEEGEAGKGLKKKLSDKEREQLPRDNRNFFNNDVDGNNILREYLITGKGMKRKISENEEDEEEKGKKRKIPENKEEEEEKGMKRKISEEEEEGMKRKISEEEEEKGKKRNISENKEEEEKGKRKISDNEEEEKGKRKISENEREHPPHEKRDNNELAAMKVQKVRSERINFFDLKNINQNFFNSDNISNILREYLITFCQNICLKWFLSHFDCFIDYISDTYVKDRLHLNSSQQNFSHEISLYSTPSNSQITALIGSASSLCTSFKVENDKMQEISLTVRPISISRSKFACDLFTNLSILATSNCMYKGELRHCKTGEENFEIENETLHKIREVLSSKFDNEDIGQAIFSLKDQEMEQIVHNILREVL